MEDERYLPPEKVPSGIFSDDGFEVIRSQFFSSSSEPVLSFGRMKMWVNSVCLKRFQETEYIQILVNRGTRTLTRRHSRQGRSPVVFCWQQKTKTPSAVLSDIFCENLCTYGVES